MYKFTLFRKFRLSLLKKGFFYITIETNASNIVKKKQTKNPTCIWNTVQCPKEMISSVSSVADRREGLLLMRMT